MKENKYLQQIRKTRKFWNNLYERKEEEKEKRKEGTPGYDSILKKWLGTPEFLMNEFSSNTV